MQRLSVLAVLICSCTWSITSLAEKEDFTEKNEEGRVHITWQSPQNYRDIEPVMQTDESFRSHIFEELDKELEKLAKDLPEGQLLELTFTNIDLAGKVWPGSFIGMGLSGGDVRVVKRIDIPRLAFSYVLKDKDGTELKADEVNIKDMNFLDRLPGRYRDRPYAYEKRMLREWFDDTLLSEAAKS